jgi:asparagine synthase (glutamine-hydrolysing)
MCGVFGLICSTPIDPAILDSAGRIQSHRGPDGSGRYIGQLGQWQLGLAHQRLAIIDLSAAGVQPMQSPSGRSLIIFNGEIYNYVEMRAELEALGVVFRSHTDTEVIAAACEQYGVADALTRMNGMWSFAWVDLHSATVVLARDRFGVKPLYLRIERDRIAFASEIKTLLRALQLRCAVNTRVVSAFIRSFQLDTNDETFFEGITKLPAGHYAVFDARQRDLKLQVIRYWSLAGTATSAVSVETAGEQVRALLEDAVRLRLRSDVPIGLLLSGGLDSSAIAAVAEKRLGPQADFSLVSAVSSDPQADESHFIHMVARHIGRDVHEVRLEFPKQGLLALISAVTEQADEPIGGFSCVAQYLIMQRARELGVTVLLSGQGADEVFCGYRKYTAFYLASLLREGNVGAALRLIAAVVGKGTALSKFSLADARRYLPRWSAVPTADIGGPALLGLAPGDARQSARSGVRARQLLDIEHFSIPALTHWEDRSSMAWSREVRNPFLDYRLVSLGVGLPTDLKIHEGWPKYILRRAIEELLPAAIAWRRDKRGFTTPEARLLREDLRHDVDALFTPSSEMTRRGLIDAAAARRAWAQFIRDRKRPPAATSRRIFQLVSLELWLRAYAAELSG